MPSPRTTSLVRSGPWSGIWTVGHLRVMDQITLVRPCGRPSLWAAEVREARLVSLLPAKVGRGPKEDKGCQSKWLRLGRNATS